MKSTARPIADEELVAQMGWVRGLARSLVRDPNVAEDVAQGTFFTALERPPHTAHSGASLRAWLAAVTRTLARQSVRGETRRHAREHKAARSEADASTVDRVAREEVQARVVAAVQALDEPYRTTVLLRYLRGLSAPEIAERMECTPVAVRKRLSRGLQQLRGELDARCGGDGRQWLGALLPLAGLRGERLASVGGAGGLTAVLGSVTALGVAAWLLLAPDPTSPPDVAPRALRSTLSASPTTSPAPNDARPRALTPRRALPELTTPAAPRAVPGSAAPSLPVRGRVLDSEGRALPELELLFEVHDADFALPYASGPGARLLGRADAHGEFDLGLAKSPGRVRVVEPGWTTVEAGFPERGAAERGVVLVAAPAARLAGRVRDADGAPIEGVRARFVLPADYASRFDVARGDSAPERIEARSDALGRFELPALPLLRGGELELRAPGWSTERVAVDRQPPAELDVVLRSTLLRVSGRVEDVAGRAVADAVVSNGVRAVRSDARGEFTLAWEADELRAAPAAAEPGHVRALLAVKPGYQPGRLDVPVDAESGAPLWPDPLVLRLGPPPLTLRGHVRDTAGRPVPDALVWIDDGSVLRRGRTFFAEDANVSTDGKPHDDPDADDEMRLIESLLVGDDDALAHRVRADADGAFALPGLLDRAYTVLALDPVSRVRAVSSPVHPAAGPLELRLDPAARIAVLGGVVRDLAGEPLPGVQVALHYRGVLVRDVDGGVRNALHDAGGTALTDAAGRFAFHDVPRAWGRLRVTGDAVVPREFAQVTQRDGLVELAGERPDALVLELARRAELQLRRPADSPVDRVGAVDAAGEPLPLNRFEVSRHTAQPWLGVHAGRSPIFVLPEDAAALRLFVGEREVERVPLALRVDALNVVR